MKARILVKCVQNPHVLAYHTTAEISQSHIKTFERPLRETSEKYLEEIGEEGAKIVRGIFLLQGVESVSIYPYEMSVFKAEAFDWEGIHPEVLGMLKSTVAYLLKVPVEEVEVTDGYDESRHLAVQKAVEAEESNFDEESEESDFSTEAE